VENRAQPSTLALRDAVKPDEGQDVALSRLPITCPWWLAFLVSTVLVVGAHLFLKAGIRALVSHPMAGALVARIASYFTQPMIVTGLALYALGSVFWMITVAQKDVSFLYPLTSVNYVLVVIGSAFLFQEVISIRRGLGVLVIVLGVALLNRGHRGATA